MEASSYSSGSENVLKHEIMAVGIKLRNPPSAVTDLLKLLAKVENTLSQIGQDPSRSMRDAVSPSMNALVSNELLKHPSVDVKVSVVSCIHEIVRITAPCQPYGDEKMKEIFELTIVAFGMLSHLSGHCYSKALQILETVAKVRSCVMLLDLGCDAVVVQIFELLLSTIRSNHPESVFSNMEEVMTWLLAESDDISLDLLRPLLSSVKKENEAVSPISCKLGEEVIKSCSAKIQPHLINAVRLMRLNFDDYSELISSLCQDEPNGGILVDEDVKPDVTHLWGIGVAAPNWNDLNVQKSSETNFILEGQNSLETVESLSQQNNTQEITSLNPGTLANGGAIPGRRGRAPNSLMKPKTVRGKNFRKKPHEKMNYQIRVNSANNSSPRGSAQIDWVNSPNSQNGIRNDTSGKKRGRPKKDSTRKDEQNAGASIKMVSGYVEDAEEKPKQRGSKKKKSSRSDRVAVPALSRPKKENDRFSESEAKPYSLTKATEKKASLQKRNTGKSNVKGSKRSALVKEYGEELVGSKINVWWPLDQTFYEGMISSFNLSTKKHEVLYTDGDKEILNLNKERWILIDDDEDADPSNSTVTPAKAEKTKAKRISKQNKTVSSAKRSSKGAPRKSA